MKKIVVILGAVMLALSSQAQMQSHMVVSGGTLPPRAYMMSYQNRQVAVDNDYTKSVNYIALPKGATSARFELPTNWLDRNVYIHQYGSGEVTVNGYKIGFDHDTHSVSEFLLNGHIKSGDNSITYNGDAFIYSQPKVHIEDYYLTQSLDETYKDGIFAIAMCISNNFNRGSGELQVGYDLEDATGALIDYSYREVSLEPDSRDTISFSRKLPKVKMWSAENPYLYTLVLKIKRDGTYIEYSSQKIGFRTSEIKDDQLLINGKPITIKGFNILPTTPVDEASFKAMKKLGINTLRTKQQERGFYELANRYGFYVLNEANITTPHLELHRGGSPTNNPQWLGAYMARTASVYHQTKNYPSVIFWSLAGEAGRGYNLYKTYKYMKAVETVRPVIYEGAGMEWNSDIHFPKIQGGFTDYYIPQKAVPVKAPAKKKRR